MTLNLRVVTVAKIDSYENCILLLMVGFASLPSKESRATSGYCVVSEEPFKFKRKRIKMLG